MGLPASKRRSREFSQAEADLYAEMSRLYDAGYSLIPLGLGDDGKSPAASFGGRNRLPLAVVWKRMGETRSLMYGIRLPNVVVVDIDTMTDATDEYVRRRFGTSPVHVLTRRGRHLYFRIGEGAVPGNVREDGIAIDVKKGPNSYVVGPKSIRIDGTVYLYEGSPLPGGRKQAWRLLPVFVDRKPKVAKKGSGKVGERHALLLTKACEYAWTADSEEGLFDDLCRIRDWELEDAEGMEDGEIRSLAAWAWKKRLQNDLWSGRESVVKVRRSVQDALMKREYGCEAWALYTVLEGAHGHLPGHRFAIVAPAMRKAGLLPLAEKAIRRARDILLDEGLIVKVRRRPGFKQADEFQLTKGTAKQGDRVVPLPA